MYFHILTYISPVNTTWAYIRTKGKFDSPIFGRKNTNFQSAKLFFLIPFYFPGFLISSNHNDKNNVLAGNYLFKVSNRNTRARCEIGSNLTIYC